MANTTDEYRSPSPETPAEGLPTPGEHARLHHLLAMVDEPEQPPFIRSRMHSTTPTLYEDYNDRRSSKTTTQRHSFNSMNEKEVDNREHMIQQKYAERLCSKCKHLDRDQEAALGAMQIVPPEKEEDNKIVSWDGEHDPKKPMNMPEHRKWMIVISTGLMTFCVSFASSVFSTTTFVTAELFGVSSEVMILGLSLYVLGFAFGPLVWGPLSEAFGRTRPLFAGMIIFCIFQVPVAVAQNLQTIFICRFLGGVAGSAPLAIIGGMYVDFMEPINRGVATSVFAGAVFAGPVAGPVVGSFITYSYLGWRWTAWITLIMSAFFTIIAYLLTPETYEPVLLAWKADKLRHETKDWALHSKSEEDPLNYDTIVNKYLMKPLVMIVKEPILIILTLYMSLVYGILYLTFEAYPISFEMDRGWSPGLASLPFIAIFIGVVLACAIIGGFSKTWYAKRLIASGKLNPEDRLPPMIAGSLILPIGLFWFAWTSHPDTHWAAQVVSGIFIGLGIILIFMSGVTYMVDVYLLNANSAIAINTFIRSAVAAGFPLFATYMYDGLGVDWATSLLAFVCIALIPFPFVFWFYGKKIRSWSKFAFNLG
ncbi:MFS general substrate transporter [Aureobasidium pullulans]|uniref:Cercosporin MFS transporter CTB4 n=1 Tax=Aureobasidium pullulans TaxID=5580 RepID=A0A4S9XCY1_AURPU|nr:MFS general substrate transporter [Aureobasidium pullulans]